MNERTRLKLLKRGVAQVKPGQRNNALVVAANQMAKDGLCTDQIAAELGKLSACLAPPPLGESENILDIARGARKAANVQRLIDLGYTLQEAEWFLAGRSITDGSPIKDPQSTPHARPDHAMRLYRPDDHNRLAAASEVSLAVRARSFERNRQDTGQTDPMEAADIKIAKSEARRANRRRGVITHDELVAVGYMVIASESGNGSPLHGKLLRLRIRDRITREIARQNVATYAVGTALTEEHDNDGNS